MKKVIFILSLIFAVTLGATAYAEGEEYVYSPNSDSAVLKLALENAGYNEDAVIAILSNISVETCGRFDPTIINHVCDSASQIDEFPASGSVGLAQWTGARKDNLKAFAEAENTSPLDINTQVRFLIKEMNDNGFTPGNLNKYSLEQSTYIIFRKFLTASSDAPLTFDSYLKSYVKYMSDDSSATLNYRSALAVAKNQSSVVKMEANVRASNQYGPPCEPILPSDYTRVYGLNTARGDIKTHGDIGVIRACMNKFVGTSFDTTNNTYDQQLADAVTKFQKNKGIWNSGISGRVGKTTRCAICKARYPASTSPASYNNYCTRASNCGGSKVPTTPTAPTQPTTPTGTTIGVQDVSKYAKQGDYANVYWKYKKPSEKYPNNWKKKSLVSVSGCSMIAVVNALYSLRIVGNVNTYVKNLAKWTIERRNTKKELYPAQSKPKVVTTKNWDGRWTDGDWDKIRNILNYYSNLKSKVGYRTLSLSGKAKTKLDKVKSELSKGNALIFFGKNGAPFSEDGHFVTVVGVTANDEFVVANAKGSSSFIKYTKFFDGRAYSSPYVIYKK